VKSPSPACFKDWQEHDVTSHIEWFKKDKGMSVTVQLFGSSWGYLITKRSGVSHEVIEGKFDWEWTAMDACTKAEEAFTRAIAKEGVA
jgi:hypothetical protein